VIKYTSLFRKHHKQCRTIPASASHPLLVQHWFAHCSALVRTCLFWPESCEAVEDTFQPERETRKARLIAASAKQYKLGQLTVKKSG